jgi:hypothetical protein
LSILIFPEKVEDSDIFENMKKTMYQENESDSDTHDLVGGDEIEKSRSIL